MPTMEELKMLQALPLEIKVMKTKARIREWVQHYGLENVYVSFSGGKDSSVLLDIARQEYPQMEAIFVDTGLEYPEIREFVKGFENVTWLHPKMSFYEVIKTYGYPLISKEVSECISQTRIFLDDVLRERERVRYQYRINKYSRLPLTNLDETKQFRMAKISGMLTKNNELKTNPTKEERSRYDISKYAPLLDVDFNISHKCCGVMKKGVVHKINKYAITGQTAEESMLRTKAYLVNGCNGFKMKRPVSNPMGFWKEQDILRYIYEHKLPIAKAYGDVIIKGAEDGQMTFFELANELGSCKFCTTGCDRTGCIFCGFGLHLEKEPTRFQRLKQTHPKLYDYCMGGGEYNEEGLWQPNKQGLGMRHIFEELNRIYGIDFIKYE